MDERFRANEIQMRSQPLSIFPNELIYNFRNQNFVAVPRLEGNFADHSCKYLNFLPPDSTPSKVATGSSVNHEEDSAEDYDSSDVVLRYIDKMLMEEDVEEMTCMLQDSIELQAAEKSFFYEVLGNKYLPFPEQSVNENRKSQEGSFMQNLSEQQSPNFPIYSISQPSCSLVTGTVDGHADSQNSTIHVTDWNGKIQSICQFRKAVEDARKFLPRGNNLFVNLDGSMAELAELNVGNSDLVGQEEKKDKGEYSARGMKGRKNLRSKNFVAEEERSRQQTAVHPDLSVRLELYDTVLLSNSLPGQTAAFGPQETLQNGIGRLPKVTNGEKGRGKKQNGEKEKADVRALLIRCGQAIARDDHRNVNELLKQIKQHASLVGDANQRLAQCFVDALEARLAGTSSQIYKGIIGKRISAADALRGY